jgi:hypothetical protein
MAWYDSTTQRSAVREYKSRSEMDRDIAHAGEKGWRVVSVNEMSQRSGCLRFLTLGLLTLFFKPKSHYLVTYQHD